jgi:hypothetical protein
MSARAHSRKSRLRPAVARTARPPDTPPVTPPACVPPNPGTASAPEQLTPEEQMERFAKELKNEDWGHQPC